MVASVPSINQRDGDIKQWINVRRFGSYISTKPLAPGESPVSSLPSVISSTLFCSGENAMPNYDFRNIDIDFCIKMFRVGS